MMKQNVIIYRSDIFYFIGFGHVNCDVIIQLDQQTDQNVVTTEKAVTLLIQPLLCNFISNECL